MTRVDRLQSKPCWSWGDVAELSRDEDRRNAVMARRIEATPEIHVGRGRDRPVLAPAWGLRQRPTPENRGALFHAVEITIGENGTMSGRVIQAFEPDESVSRYSFGERRPEMIGT